MKSWTSGKLSRSLLKQYIPLMRDSEKQGLRVENMSFEPNDVITRNIFTVAFSRIFEGNLENPDGYLLKSNGKRSLNLQIKPFQEELLEINRSNAELVDRQRFL